MVSVKTTALELPFFFILKRQYTEQLADRQADQFTDDSNQLKQMNTVIVSTMNLLFYWMVPMENV